MAKGFKHGAGATDALNFKVVGGTSQPSSPSENTVWVNTDMDITGWAFSATEPVSPADGMVWFVTTGSGKAAFNVLRNNTIMVYPSEAYQYSHGLLETKSAQIYIGGEWIDFGLYLYTPGDECTDVSGGWVSEGKKASSSSGASSKEPTITRGTDTIKAAITTAGHSGVFYATARINLTGYTKLVAKGEFYNSSANEGNLRLAVWSSLSTYYTSNMAAYVVSTPEVVTNELELNVSKLDGEYIIGFVINTYSGSSSYVTLSKCYLT